jgi:phi13 family phage major tail protein
MFVEGERQSKYFAIGYITEKTDGTEIFVWRLKGKFNIPDSTHATKNDGADANGQEIVFTGINTIHKFTAIGNKTAKAVNVDTSVNPVVEADFFAEVQTPDTVQPTV